MWWAGHSFGPRFTTDIVPFPDELPPGASFELVDLEGDRQLPVAGADLGDVRAPGEGRGGVEGARNTLVMS